MKESGEQKNRVVSLEPISDAELIDVDAGRGWGWENGGWTTVNAFKAEAPTTTVSYSDIDQKLQ